MISNSTRSLRRAALRSVYSRFLAHTFHTLLSLRPSRSPRCPIPVTGVDYDDGRVGVTSQDRRSHYRPTSRCSRESKHNAHLPAAPGVSTQTFGQQIAKEGLSRWRVSAINSSMGRRSGSCKRYTGSTKTVDEFRRRLSGVVREPVFLFLCCDLLLCIQRPCRAVLPPITPPDTAPVIPVYKPLLIPPDILIWLILYRLLDRSAGSTRRDGFSCKRHNRIS